MASALIGHTGFVGSNLSAQHPFDAFYNSKNIEGISGERFELLVVSAMPAAMWIANRDPVTDRASLDRLLRALQNVRARQVVVISTVAVYPDPVGADEASLINPDRQTPYGRHRLILEQQLESLFSRVLVVRLPGLFGCGLKKNVIYDLLHHNEVAKIDSESQYQFYSLERLWRDVSRALAAELRVVNFATEPTKVREIAREVFGFEFSNHLGSAPIKFDVRSRFSAAFGGCNGYLYDLGCVLDDLRCFVQRERTASKP